MSDAVIRVQNLSKRYRIGQVQQRHDTLREAIVANARASLGKIWPDRGQPGQPTTNTFWALDDVSFEVQAGEVLGVIGQNGAGKSTLLKILARITEPTSGKAEIHGRVGSLLEVGTGFHPELTGRENVFLNGAILGMRRTEITRRFEEIVDFAGIERFIDTPVKRYSSGMYVRLAFAVAAHLEPEVLLVDEVLAVGDATFQKKCLNKMDNVAQSGRTVLFVSHNMAAMSALAEKVIYLNEGRIVAYDVANRVIDQYLWESQREPAARGRSLDNYRREFSTDTPVRTTGITVISDGYDDSTGIPVIDMGGTIVFQVQIQAHRKIQDAHLDITLRNSRGERVAILFTRDQDFPLDLEPGVHLISASVADLPLAPGYYSVDIGINQSMGTKAYDVILDYPAFRILGHAGLKFWLDRPWGAMHCSDVQWSSRPSSDMNDTGKAPHDA